MEALGSATQIVGVLRDFGSKPIPLGLVARKLHREELEVRETVDQLVAEGVLAVQGDRVSISENGIQPGPV